MLENGKNTGCVISRRITGVVCDLISRKSKLDKIPTYNDVKDVVYGEMLNIVHEQEKGDWIEMPNGATYTMVFKPNEGLEFDTIFNDGCNRNNR